MEGDLPDWTGFVNFDAGFNPQPWGYEENQGDGAAENATFDDWDHDLHDRALSDPAFFTDQTSIDPSDSCNNVVSGPKLSPVFQSEQFWPRGKFSQYDSHLTGLSSASMLDLPDAYSQQYARITGLPDHALNATCSSFRFADDGLARTERAHRTQSVLEPNVAKSSSASHQSKIESSTSLLVSDLARQCNCMSCVGSGAVTNVPEPRDSEPRSGLADPGPRWSTLSLACRFPGCTKWTSRASQEKNNRYYTAQLQRLKLQLAKHERTHFGEDGEYHCLEEGCNTTTKKFADLKRHYRNRHCTNAPKFPCPVFGCKYGGDNGFTREDKLKSHHRNVHQGKAIPGKAFQPFQPKTDGAKVVKGKATGGV